MRTSSDERNPVELLAEEFLDRKRRGEHPTLDEYRERHPELADDIRDLFPALLMMEDLGQSSGGTTGSLAADNGLAVAARLERLGDYRILREIGRGGMGVVYEAEQESLGRRVALKVLSAGSLLDPKQVRRFEREAKAAAKLHHTNIVPVFGVGRQDGHHYFVMQFIAGLGLDVVLDDLRRLRQSKSGANAAAESASARASSRVAGLTGVDVARSLITGRFDADRPSVDASMTEPFDETAPGAANGSPADSGSAPAILPGSSELSASSDPDRQFYRSIARIGIQVAEALEYANRQGILHRDVKPSNLLLDNHGNVWVADFGLAKTSRRRRPDPHRRHPGHHPLHGAGAVRGALRRPLRRLQPGTHALRAGGIASCVRGVGPAQADGAGLARGAGAAQEAAPGVPRDLDTIVAKATARDPATRYATAAAMAEDLRRFVEDRPIRARRISPMERAWRWCRRNKGLASSFGLAVAAMVVALGLALVRAADLSRLASDRALRIAEQAKATEQITRLASDLEKESGALKDERSHLRTALSESNRRLAMLNFERGRAAFEKGRLGSGMLWTVEVAADGHRGRG